MKMIITIFSILFTVEAQYADNESTRFSSKYDISTTNDLNLIPETTTNEDKSFSSEFTSLVSSGENIEMSSFNNDETKTSTIVNDFVSKLNWEETESTSSLFTRDHSSFSSTNSDLDSKAFSDQTLFTKQIPIEEEWFNVNPIDRESSSLFWKKIYDPSWNGKSYILTSQGQCLRRMCSVKLKYNGSLPNDVSGCLSFILWTRGHPVGQIWIEEDEEQESLSQKIQLTNNSLRVEHSFKSKIKNLSIDARILFTNPQMDLITLSNLNLDLKGPCPKHRSVPTAIPEIIVDQSTSEDDLTSLSREDSSLMITLATTNIFENSENDLLIESSTIKFYEKENNRRSFTFFNENNIVYFLSFIFLFCLFLILSAFIYGLWSIQRHYRFIWYIPFDSPIQFLARRSIRSSTRSDYKISTLSQIAFNLLNTDFEEENLRTNSSRSTPSSTYTYF